MKAPPSRRTDKLRTDRGNNRANVAALLAVAVIAAVLFWAMSALRSHNAVQDCIDSGRKDCVDLQ